MTGRFSHPGQVQVNTLIQWEWAPALSLSLTLTNKLTEPETLTKVLCDCQGILVDFRPRAHRQVELEVSDQ